jgi:hypothetical protein
VEKFQEKSEQVVKTAEAQRNHIMSKLIEFHAHILYDLAEKAAQAQIQGREHAYKFHTLAGALEGERKS